MKKLLKNAAGAKQEKNRKKQEKNRKESERIGNFLERQGIDNQINRFKNYPKNNFFIKTGNFDEILNGKL